MADPYKPIACALYDRYERAIITRSPLVIAWREGESQCQDTVFVRTLETAGGQEFLGFEDSGQHLHRIRLDAIRVLG